MPALLDEPVRRSSRLGDGLAGGWCRLSAFSLFHPRKNITEEIQTP